MLNRALPPLRSVRDTPNMRDVHYNLSLNLWPLPTRNFLRQVSTASLFILELLAA